MFFIVFAKSEESAAMQPRQSSKKVLCALLALYDGIVSAILTSPHEILMSEGPKEGGDSETSGTLITQPISRPLKRGRLIPSAIECLGEVPPLRYSIDDPPGSLSTYYDNLRDLCAADSYAPAGNMGCTCEDDVLHCPRSTTWEIQDIVRFPFKLLCPLLCVEWSYEIYVGILRLASLLPRLNINLEKGISDLESYRLITVSIIAIAESNLTGDTSMTLTTS
ncbi:hypothetical protein N7G274_004042 [Stereocaulon virgatum]|uniref:Uncharacterized protein n=1 Tax=Stereocaulon virgatum TaxID=373712 RepID=A0ABR4ABY6_9LECA